MSTQGLRSDAARNRDKIVAAARQVFREQGTDAGVEEIAHRAGVGVGTLYRRFPTKESLIDAIVNELFRQVLGTAQRALATEPPETALASYLRGVGQLQAEHVGCLARLWNYRPEDGVRDELQATVRRLLAGAQAAGAVRDDIVYEDVPLIMWSLRGIIETTVPVAPKAWQRHLDLVLAGLRPSKIGLSQPPITRSQMDRVFAATHDTVLRGKRAG